MLSNIGFSEILLIAVVVLVIFGPDKLPEIGRAMGKAMQEFKKGMKGVIDDEEETSSASPSNSSNTSNPSPSSRASTEPADAGNQRSSSEAKRKIPD